ncbi:hypothetical protein Slin14017_G068490 [Septoria linicola]|nr:hypothetical protein Slin14017_G068490 [Septoria linicola]
MDEAQRETMLGASLAPIAPMVAPTAPQLIVKLPIRLPAMMPDPNSLASTHGSTPMDIDDPVSSEQAINSRSDLHAENGATTAEIKLLLDPPYVVEPDSTTSLWLEGATPELIAAHRKSTLEEFYGYHVFVCQFHTPITKFLRQLDSDYLKRLRPGSVRLTSKLSHMGFVHRGLQDFNERSADGLRPDVAIMPVTLENEANDVWVSWADVDDFDGLRGGWNAGEGTVAKRKPPARKFLDSNDDELYT